MGMPEDKIRKVLKIAKEPISMETPIGDDEDSHLGDFIEDTTLALPADSATSESLKAATRDVLSGLTAREAKVKLYGDYTKLNGVYYSNLRWL
jgi:RNA polymerase primary sigma factor